MLFSGCVAFNYAIIGMATPLATQPAYQPLHDNINIKVTHHKNYHICRSLYLIHRTFNSKISLANKQGDYVWTYKY